MDGLKRKYQICKANGDPLPPHAECFVLRVDKDPHAKAALRAYADSVRDENPQFAQELDYWADHGLAGFTPDALVGMGFRADQPNPPAHRPADGGSECGDSLGESPEKEK